MIDPFVEADPGEQREVPESGRPELVPWTPTVRVRIAEAWDQRYLLPGMATRSVPVYPGRILGRGWIVIRPFMQVLGFSIVFGGVFKAKAPNGGPYLVFMLLNIQAFRLFEHSLLYETLSSRTAKATKQLRAPLLLLPIASTFRGLLELAIYWFFTASVLIYYIVTTGHLYLDISPRLLVGVAGLLLCLLLGLAIGLASSVIYPRAMDVRYIVRYGGQLLLFLSPVFYSSKSLPSGWRPVLEANPLSAMIELVQYGFLGGPFPGTYSLAWSLSFLVLATLGGLWFFNNRATQWIGIYSRSADGDDEDDDF